MKKFMQKKLNNEKGMTLIELLAVIVILAIIAAIAIPAIGNIIENSRYSAIKSDATNVMSAANIYFTDGNPGTTAATSTAPAVVTIEALKNAGYLEDPGSFKDNTAVTDSFASGTASTPSKISGDAEVGNIKLTFLNATKEDISKISRETPTPVSTITVTAAGN